ncbi:MAG: DUF3955 domain-containing protein [Vagococcus sp.]
MLQTYKLPLILVSITIICFAISSYVGTTIDNQGVLHEPAFFLIPIAFLSLLIAIVSSLYITIKHWSSQK